MPMQLTAAELDAIHTVTGQGKSTNEVYAHICANRGRARKPKLDVGIVRRPIKGHPHQQSEPETRGRKRSLSRSSVMEMKFPFGTQATEGPSHTGGCT